MRSPEGFWPELWKLDRQLGAKSWRGRQTNGSVRPRHFWSWREGEGMPYIATWQNTSVMKGVIYRGGRLDVDQSVSSEAEWQFPDRDTAIRRRYVYGGTFGGLIVTNLIVLSIATNLSPEQDFSKTFQNNDPVMSMREGAQEMRHGLWAPEESDFHRLLQIMRLGVAGEHDVHPPGQGDPGAL